MDVNALEQQILIHRWNQNQVSVKVLSDLLEQRFGLSLLSIRSNYQFQFQFCRSFQFRSQGQRHHQISEPLSLWSGRIRRSLIDSRKWSVACSSRYRRARRARCFGSIAGCLLCPSFDSWRTTYSASACHECIHQWHRFSSASSTASMGSPGSGTCSTSVAGSATGCCLVGLLTSWLWSQSCSDGSSSPTHHWPQWIKKPETEYLDLQYCLSD